jgi:hypothetical protein
LKPGDEVKICGDALPVHFREVLQLLDKSLQESDPVASASCIKEIRANFFMNDFEADLKSAEQQIKNYHFDVARKALKSVFLKFNDPLQMKTAAQHSNQDIYERTKR